MGVRCDAGQSCLQDSIALTQIRLLRFLFYVLATFGFVSSIVILVVVLSVMWWLWGSDVSRDCMIAANWIPRWELWSEFHV